MVPPASGVFSAFGLLFARIEHRLVRTCMMDSAVADLDRLASLAQALQDEATALMRAEGVGRDGCELICQLDLRYRGQSSELAVTVPIPLTRAVLDQTTEAFHAEHERTYGYGNPGEATKIVNLRLRARPLVTSRSTSTPIRSVRRPASRLPMTDRSQRRGPMGCRAMAQRNSWAHPFEPEKPIDPRPSSWAVRYGDPEWHNFLDFWAKFMVVNGEMDRLLKTHIERISTT